MKNKTKGLLFQIPAMIIILLAVIGGFYIKIANIFPVKWITPITILVIGILYFVGVYYFMKVDNNW